MRPVTFVTHNDGAGKTLTASLAGAAQVAGHKVYFLDLDLDPRPPGHNRRVAGVGRASEELRHVA